MPVEFDLHPGFQIGNYRVIRRLGSGCTAEAYLVEEVPTQAERVLKIYELFEDCQRIRNLRDFAHYGWVLEQASFANLLPRYYHMGHTFLNDEIGHYFIVQEFLDGDPFDPEKCTPEMIEEFRRKVRQVHDKCGFALSDCPKNLRIVDKQIRIVDCNYGKHNELNTNFAEDIAALRDIFGVE